MPDRLYERIHSVLRFLGKQAAILLALNVSGSILLSLAEIAIAAFIQLFLSAIGLVPPKVSGFLASFEFSVVQVCILLAIIGLVRSSGQFLVGLSSGFAAQTIQERLRTTLIAYMLESSSPPSSSKVHTLASELFPKSAGFANSAAQFFAISLQMIVVLSAMLFIAWKEALLALFGFFFVGMIVLKLNRKVRAYASELPGIHEKVVQTIERVNSSWLLIFLLGTQNEEFVRSKANIENYTNRYKKSHRYNVTASSLAPFLGILILVQVILISQNYLKTSPEILLAFLYLFIRFTQNLSAGVNNFGSLNGNFPHFYRAFSFFKESEIPLRKAIRETRKVGKNHTAINQRNDNNRVAKPVSIDIENMTYRYAQGLDPVFSDFSLHINPGEQLGIIGPSGVGKSTLISLIIGVFKPESGEIKIDGISADKALKDKLYRIGYVGAQPFLFEGTVRENLTYGNNLESTNRKMLEMLWSLKLFEGDSKCLDYKVETGGTNYSTGQRQRLCVARALINKPQLLVLDEVSANLDTASEEGLCEILKDLKGICSVVIVTHRPGIIKHSDRVVDLAKTT